MRGIPPPVITYSGEARQRINAPEATKSAIPTIAIPFLLPFLLPFWAVRYVYRKATGYEPPPPQDMVVADPEELASAIDAICSGSGREVESADTGCPKCKREIGVMNGRLLTHQAQTA